MARTKKSRNSEIRTAAPCSELPAELLFSIMLRLSFIDYVLCSTVCKDWYRVAAEHKEIFVKSHPPLLVYKSKNAKRTCQFHDIFGERSYKAMLPDITSKRFIGLCCGYLIMLDTDRRIHLVNLLTGHRIQFPVLPFCEWDSSCETELRPILFRSTKLSDYVMVCVDRKKDSVFIAQSRGAQWVFAERPKDINRIADVGICEGKVYFLTESGRFGEVKMSPTPILQPLKIGINFSLFSPLQLVSSNKSLFIVSYNCYVFLVYKLDVTKMEWTCVNNLGQSALFLSYAKCSMIVDLTDCEAPRNCLYISSGNSVGTEWFDDMDEEIPDYRIVPKVAHAQKPYLWYSPREATVMNESHEELDLQGCGGGTAV